MPLGEANSPGSIRRNQKSQLKTMQPIVEVGQRFKFTVLMDDALTERQGVVTRVLSNREEGLGLDVDQYMSYWVEAHELPETEFSTTLVFVRSADGKIYLDGKVTDVTLLP
jgi:hypothetical protein